MALVIALSQAQYTDLELPGVPGDGGGEAGVGGPVRHGTQDKAEIVSTS